MNAQADGHPTREQLVEQLKALGHPFRLDLFERIAREESSIADIHRDLRVAQPLLDIALVSYHVHKLVDAELIACEHSQRIGNFDKKYFGPTAFGLFFLECLPL